MLALPRTNVDARDPDSGWTALHFASRQGKLKAVEVLIKNKAFVAARGPNGRTPLHLAAGWGTIEVWARAGLLCLHILVQSVSFVSLLYKTTVLPGGPCSCACSCEVFDATPSASLVRQCAGAECWCPSWLVVRRQGLLHHTRPHATGSRVPSLSNIAKYYGPDLFLSSRFPHPLLLSGVLCSVARGSRCQRARPRRSSRKGPRRI